MHLRSFSTKPPDTTVRKYARIPALFRSVRQGAGKTQVQPANHELGAALRRMIRINAMQRLLTAKLTELDRCLWLLNCDLESDQTLALLKHLESLAGEIETRLKEAELTD